MSLTPKLTLSCFLALAFISSQAVSADLPTGDTGNENAHPMADLVSDDMSTSGASHLTSSEQFVCGDADNNGVVSVSDVGFLVDYLYAGGGAPPDYDQCDGDDFSVVTSCDLVKLVRFLFLSAAPPLCPPARPRLHDLAVVDDSIYVHTYESVFPYAAILEPDDSTYTIHVHLSTDTTLDLANIPIAVRIGSDIPEIQSVEYVAPYTNTWTVDHANGIIAGVSGSLSSAAFTPGTYEVMRIEVKVPPLHNTWRPITIALDSLHPIQNGQYAHQPWAVTGGSNPDVFRPEVYYLPCLGERRGNINYDSEDKTDISDLTYMVNYMFKDDESPKCFEEIDVTADLRVDISDLTYLIAYMFQESNEPPALCPQTN